MANNLTGQVCATSPRVTTAVAKRRPRARKITVRCARRPRILELKSTIKHDGRPALLPSDGRGSRAFRAPRSATEGRLGRSGRGPRAVSARGADPHGVRELPRVQTSPNQVRKTSPQVHDRRSPTGDLSKKDRRRRAGREIAELKDTINTMVDQLKLLRRRGHARRAREVGTEGKLRRPRRRSRGRVGHVARPSRSPSTSSPTTSPTRSRNHRPGSRPRFAEPATLSKKDHRRRAGAKIAELSRTRSTRWSTSSTPSPPRVNARVRAPEVGTEGKARRPRRRSRASRAPGAGSRTNV